MKFQKLYEEIKEQRKSISADVDRFGLSKIVKSDDETYKFLLIIHLILSSQTKDIYTYESTTNFISKNIYDCHALSKLQAEEIQEMIKKVGFAKQKAMYLQTFAKSYRNKALPCTYNEIIGIKGIGNKMAYLYLQFACNLTLGIGVDTHVLRVSKRLGLDVKSADKCEKKLQNIFEKDEWYKINHTLVGFGQEICRAVRPKCNECCVKFKCPSSEIKLLAW